MQIKSSQCVTRWNGTLGVLGGRRRDNNRNDVVPAAGSRIIGTCSRSPFRCQRRWPSRQQSIGAGGLAKNGSIQCYVRGGGVVPRVIHWPFEFGFDKRERRSLARLLPPLAHTRRLIYPRSFVSALCAHSQSGKGGIKYYIEFFACGLVRWKWLRIKFAPSVNKFWFWGTFPPAEIISLSLYCLFSLFLSAGMGLRVSARLPLSKRWQFSAPLCKSRFKWALIS
jgi:hypothetical protein